MNKKLISLYYASLVNMLFTIIFLILGIHATDTYIALISFGLAILFAIKDILTYIKICNHLC